MIVIDSSFFLTNVFNDEDNSLVSEVFKSIEQAELEALAPFLFFYEIHNSLITAVRKRRVKKSQIPEFLELFAFAPITIDYGCVPEAVMNVAFIHGLSFYDASYLELAKRKSIPLATMDTQLHKAAEKKSGL